MAGERILKVTIAGDASGAEKALGKVDAAAGKTAANSETAGKRISGAFGNVTKQLSNAGVLGPFAAQVDIAQNSLDQLSVKHASVAAKMMAGGGAALGAGGALAAISSGDVAAEESLKAAIEATGQSYDDYKSRIGSAGDAQVRFGHTNEETNKALATLTLATNDTGKALDDMQLVTDLAAKKNIGLNDAAVMVAKAHGGSAKLFKEFGIVVGKNADGTKNYQGALDELSKKLNGQAASSADTFKGKLKEVGAWVDNNVSQLGQKYGPALMGIGAITSTVGGITSGVSGILGKFGSAQAAATTATEGLTVATGEEAAAMDASAVSEGVALGPILLIIAAVAALAIGVYLLIDHWDEVWSAIQTGIGAAKDWIGSNWPMILAILTGPFGLAAKFIYDHWDSIISFIKGIPGRIASAAVGMWDGISGEFKSMLNGIIHMWNGLHIPSFTIGGWDTPFGTTPSFHTPQVNFPNIPTLHSGGIVPGRVGTEVLTLLQAGERVTPIGAQGGFNFYGTIVADSTTTANRVLAELEQELSKGASLGPYTQAAMARA